MSKGICYLHSHSALEREKRLPKHVVLVDEEYERLFRSSSAYVCNNRLFLKVSMLEFVRNGGVFKNLYE